VGNRSLHPNISIACGGNSRDSNSSRAERENDKELTNKDSQPPKKDNNKDQQQPKKDNNKETKEGKENSASSSTQAPVWITFSVRDSGHLWEAFLLGRKLVLVVPEEGLPEGCKEAVTELLEFAEESLQCSDVVVTFAKERADRLLVIRTLMYLGFESLAPDSVTIPKEVADPQLYFMAYNF